ncbi:tetratricopeptide repeat protein [Allorhodopirellula solitaria]|uniref:Tetratricopeptide repeat protein n=1 Tax=Allorhodopirellula solitaria TaxID=2527987 RepID=A0A5C5Y1T5_9BACT|nr:tetratricopeptide repeat protein [Allorhodopirellula solitaria]TWT67502.1 Tetratricopeptide repeat protein [Allorhodopirellula solitaria]
MSTHPRREVNAVMRRVANHFRRESYSSALREMHSLDMQNRRTSEIMYCEATALMHLNRWPEALDLLDRLADDDPSREVVLLDLATCLIEMERDREALNILAVNQENLCELAAYHVLLARVAARHWKIAQALQLVRKAIDINPNARRLIDKIPDLKAVL